MITLTKPLTKGTLDLSCQNVACRAVLRADVSEGKLKHEPGEGIYSGYDYYAFTCPYCGEDLRGAASDVKWSRDE